MKTVTDMMGRVITLDDSPKRIISLVPSQTELLYDLGLRNEVIAITRFCVHPHVWFRTKTRIGGTKKLHLEKIKSLQPDLIIANKEENTQEQIEELALHFPVWVSDIKNVRDACRMIKEVGAIVGKSEEAALIVAVIKKGFEKIRTLQAARNPPKSVVYFIWYKPWMSVGGDTFIHDVLLHAGFINVFENENRYPEIAETALKNARPDLVLLSSEPFPFKEKHAEEIKKILPGAAVCLVDGEMFSWYGSRMIKTVSYLKEFVQRTS